MQQPAVQQQKLEWLKSTRGSRLQTQLLRPCLVRRGARLKAERSKNGGLGTSTTTVRKQAPAWVTHPAFFLTATAGFAAITADIFAPWGGRWLLELIDKPTHLWVVGHLSKVVRDLVFEIGVSNVSITLGCVGWTLCTSILLSDANDEKAVGRAAGTPSLEDGKPKGSREGEAGKQEGVPVVTKSLGGKNLKRLLAIWTLYISAGGFLVPGDNYLVHYIKYICSRARPSTRHSSFSFPSGHTTAVTFIVGMLLFALLPYLLEVIETRMTEPNRVVNLGVLSGDGAQRLIRKAVHHGGKLWVIAIACTAGGRVFGDVHWVTDTAAGACLGSAIVSGYLIVSSALEARKEGR